MTIKYIELIYMWGVFNYRLTNINNIYNFIYIIINDMEEDKQKSIIKNMLLIIGNNFKTGFSEYISGKYPNDVLLKLL